jgi:hypothetical protein
LKAKIIILLSLILIAMSSYSYAACVYIPGGSLSMADFMAGKCPPEQFKVIPAHTPETPKKTHRTRYTSRRQNRALTSKGYYIGVVKQRQPDGRMLYRYKINFPCFYTAPGNNPCDRGRFRR